MLLPLLLSFHKKIKLFIDTYNDFEHCLETNGCGGDDVTSSMILYEKDDWFMDKNMFLCTIVYKKRLRPICLYLFCEFL